MGQYVMSLLCACLICAILAGAMPEGYRKLLRLIGGALIAMTLIRPISALNVEDAVSSLLPGAEDAASFIQEGETMAYRAATERIEEALGAYILTKANALGADIRVELEMTDDLPPVPRSVTIRGSVSADVIRQLSQMLEQELGIAKEDQRWTG